MLWVAAQAGERPFFGNDHKARAQSTQKLFRLVMELLETTCAHHPANAHPTPMINVWPERDHFETNSADGTSADQNIESLDVVVTYR
jgi:hypothetical protein